MTKTDYTIHQGLQPNCAIRSQEILMRDFGKFVTNEQLIEIAKEHHWYKDDGPSASQGTPRHAIGNLMEHYGVKVRRSENNSVYDLINELAQGHEIIVSVDVNELRHEMGSPEWQYFEQNTDGGNHAMIVSKIEVDPYDMDRSTVVMIDPATGDVAARYALNHFVHAWYDSRCFMVSTIDPAPYTFDGLELQISPFANASLISKYQPETWNPNMHDLVVRENWNYVFEEGHLETICGHPYEEFASLMHEGSEWEYVGAMDVLNDFFDIEANQHLFLHNIDDYPM